MRRMFGDIDRRAAIFAPKRKALRETQRDEDRRRRKADGGIARQQSDDEG